VHEFLIVCFYYFVLTGVADVTIKLQLEV
jgi:hypothetical protein